MQLIKSEHFSSFLIELNDRRPNFKKSTANNNNYINIKTVCRFCCLQINKNIIIFFHGCASIFIRCGLYTSFVRFFLIFCLETSRIYSHFTDFRQIFKKNKIKITIYKKCLQMQVDAYKICSVFLKKYRNKLWAKK